MSKTLENGTFDDQLRYLLKKYSGLELRKAITKLHQSELTKLNERLNKECEKKVKEAQLEELKIVKRAITDTGKNSHILDKWLFDTHLAELTKGKL